MIKRSVALLACSVPGVALVVALARPAHADEATYRPPEYGWSYGEIETPRTLAMGGAARAYGQATSAIPLNPANVVAQRVYHFEALFGIDTHAHRLQYGGAIVDSITSRLGMGVMASKTDLGNDGDAFRRSGIDVRVAAAYPLGDRLSFGVTGHYLRVTQDGVGPVGESPISRSSSDDANYRAFTFDAGLALSLSDSLRLGAVGYNLTNTGSALAPLMFGGGLGLNLGGLTLEANVLGVDRTTWGDWKTRVQGGLEYLFGDHYPLRVGYAFDQGSGRHAVSGGLGFVDRSFAIDGSVRADVAAPSDPWGRALVIGVGLRYFYDSAAPEPATQF